MWRDKIAEIKKEKGISTREISEKSGISADTIDRIIKSKSETADMPRIDTLADIVEKGLGAELWEVFYLGDRSLVALNAEVSALRAERDALIAELAVSVESAKALAAKVDALKDELLALMREIIKERVNAKT